VEVVVEEDARAFGLAKRSFEAPYPIQGIEITAEHEVRATHKGFRVVRLCVVKDDALNGRHPIVKVWKSVWKNHVSADSAGHASVPQPQGGSYGVPIR
jgi:hypothetical protein